MSSLYWAAAPATELWSLAMRRRWATRALIEVMTLSGSRWVWMTTASGYSAIRAAEAPQVGRRLEQPPVGGVLGLQVLEVDAVPPVGGGRIGLVQQPPLVLGDVVLGREDHRAEVAGR